MPLVVDKLDKQIRFKPKGGKEITLAFPEGMSATEAANFYAKQYPELTTAKVEGPKIENNKAVYSFSPSVGTKG